MNPRSAVASAALAALVASAPGCFLFKKDTSAPNPPAAPQGPTCGPPGAGPLSPEGFSPLPLSSLESEALVGQTVYAADQQRVGRTWVSVGQPLAVCSVRSTKSTTTTTDGESYTVEYPVAATVATAQGVQLELPVNSLSATPPKMLMETPGQADALIIQVFAHAHDLEMQRYALRQRYVDERLESAVKVGDAWSVNWDYHVERGLERASETASKLMFGIVMGHIARETLLKNDQYAWMANAQDDRIVEWYADGSKDGENGAVYEAMLECVQGLGSVNSSVTTLGLIEAERREKKWRRGLDGAAESKLAKLDAAEEKKLDGRKQTAEGFIASHVDSQACQTARAFASVP